MVAPVPASSGEAEAMRQRLMAELYRSQAAYGLAIAQVEAVALRLKADLERVRQNIQEFASR